MRKLVLGIGMCGLLGSVGQAFAQSPNENKLYEKNGVLSSGPTVPSAADRIHERAAQEARERMARIESRRWAGVSTLRPMIHAPAAYYSQMYGMPSYNSWQHAYSSLDIYH